MWKDPVHASVARRRRNLHARADRIRRRLDVTLFGRGNGGDLFVAFRWTTPADGPLAKPGAHLALLSNDDRVTSYGVELHVSDLASTPSSERAIITVRASNGTSDHI